MVDYTNVDILRRVCLAFKKIFLERENVCPFVKWTIASMCMKVFRKNFLCKEEIGIISSDDYRMKNNRSMANFERTRDWMSYNSCRTWTRI